MVMASLSLVPVAREGFRFFGLIQNITLHCTRGEYRVQRVIGENFTEIINHMLVTSANWYLALYP